MNLKTSLTLLATAAALTPSTVPAALADGCSSKLIKTSYQRISPRTVKETKIYEKTRLISKAALKHNTAHRSTFVRKTAHLAPRTFKTVTTTRTTMFIPTASVMTSPMIVRPVVVSPTATTTLRASGLVPSTTIIRASEIAPTTIVRTTAVRPACTVIKTQSVLVPAPIVSESGVVAAPGETVVFKEKHGKLKQIGTLQPVVVY